jgi:hypothetical protein
MLMKIIYPSKKAFCYPEIGPTGNRPVVKLDNVGHYPHEGATEIFIEELKKADAQQKPNFFDGSSSTIY